MAKYPFGWKEENGFLVKTFEFRNFVEAVGFVNGIVPIAEKLNHHPDIEIFSYKKVRITLISHDKNEITERDTALAERIDSLKI